MGHFLINTTFRCQLSCSYCLLPYIKIKRDIEEHTWEEWAYALIDATPPGSVLDFAGGDPLLFEGLALMLKVLANHDRRWAITTNAIDVKGVNELVEVKPGNCVLINISDHPGTYNIEENVAKLQAHFPVVFNRVDVPQAGHRRSIRSVIPYQSWKEGTELDGIRRWCNSGLYHWVADPSGDVFRCNPHMATAQPPIGNLFRRDIVIPEPIICETGCSSCYTSVPDAWPVEMKPI